MTKDAQKPTPRLTLRLSAAQQEMLERRAGARPLSTFARDQLFAANDNAPMDAPPARAKTPYRDRKAMAQALAMLGDSELSSNLAEMARLARLGALPMTPETQAVLQRASHDVADIKSLLMRGLGIKEG